MKPAGTRTTSRQKLLLMTFGLALGGLLLLLLEGALALLGLGDRGRYEDPFVGFEPGAKLFELDKRDGGGVYRTSSNKLAFFNAQEFPANKASSTYRIFALGGSTTAGRPYDDRVAFARWLELYLGDMDTSRTYEVINAGAISYASYRIALLMQELVSYEPDLFVIYTGHNEFLEERSYSDIVHEDPRRRALRQTLERLRSVRLAREALRRRLARETPDSATPPSTALPRTLLAGEVETKLAGWTGLDSYRQDEELRRSIIEHFEFNLRQMVRIARDHGIEVIFIDPISNLKDFSPFKSQPDVNNAGDDSAEALFRRGRDLFERGEYDEAKLAFVGAKDADIAPLRALEPLRERLKDVTREENVPLVDLPKILEDECQARHGHRILGNEYLLDHVHPDIPVHGRIAELVIDELVGRGTVPAPASGFEARRRAIHDQLVGSIDRDYYAVRDLNLAKVLGWSGKLEEAEPPLLRAREVLTDEPDLFLNLGILYQKTGRPLEAVPELRRAAELDPATPEVHFNLGVSQGMLGRTDDGIAALEEALKLRPSYPEARYNLGVLLRHRGDLEAASAALRQVLADRPESAEAHRELGLVYRRQNRLDDARAAFSRALDLDPSDLVARTDLGIALARQGQIQEAEAELRRVLKQDPNHAEAHYNLGVIQAGQGLRSEAVASYRRALEANPEFADAYNNLGIQLASSGELGEARRLLERAVELHPDAAESFLNLGVVYDQLGLRNQAISAVRRASELDPENARIRQALELLSQSR